MIFVLLNFFPLKKFSAHISFRLGMILILLKLYTVNVVSPVSITLFFLIPLLLHHSEPGYDR